MVSGAVATAALVCAPAAAPAAAPRPVIAPIQLLVRLLVKHPALDTPGPDGHIVAVVGTTRPLTGVRTVLPVLAQQQGSDGKRWLEVRLPGRPLHGQVLASTGWIAARGIRYGLTPWHIVVNTEKRRASVFRQGRQIRRFKVVVGKPSTPTPQGEFFVEEDVALPRGAVGAPYALATSARSNVLQEFEGGPGQIALHGRGNIGGKLGTAVSHGCIRFAKRPIEWLASHVPPGAPVTIV